MNKTVLGIDISKDKFDIVLLSGEKSDSNTFKNANSGFKELSRWLKKRASGSIEACMEATSTYGDELAEYLHAQGHRVYVVNPSRIHSFAKSKQMRTKNDRLDAHLIAEFCESSKGLTPFSPLPAEIKKLKQLTRWLDDLKSDLARTRNRVESGQKTPTLDASRQRYIEFLESEIKRISSEIDKHFGEHPDLNKSKELLESIPGVGSVCASIVLTDFKAFDGFASVRQAAAFAGVTPYRRQSGSSLNTAGCISRIGSSRIRKAFYMCAVVASRFNPVLRDAYQDLLARGKPKKLALIAIARRLIHIAFGVLKSGKRFDPQYVNSAFALSL